MKKLMRIFVVLICSLGLVSVAYTAQPEENKSQKKKQPQTVQHAPPTTTGHATGAGASPKKTSMGAYEGKKGQTSTGAYQGQKGKQGQNYTVFRNYKSEWHDQNWWHSHHNNIVFVFGAPYYWNAGYWFPAWGYYPNAYYAWDGPIYAYNRLPPDQVIANVQTVLQQQGYYQGEVDGLLGPQTRAALADYQRAG